MSAIDRILGVFADAVPGADAKAAFVCQAADGRDSAARRLPSASNSALLAIPLLAGGRITCETLKLWGVKYVFGNTGAYEAGFVDALVDFDDIHYVLGLHEGSVMAMADGYARITGQTSFVNIHSITGTANALGLIVNAWADNTPVVITAGLSPTSGDNLGTFTETSKLETIPELYTKQSMRATNIENLSESLRQSFRLAR